MRPGSGDDPFDEEGEDGSEDDEANPFDVTDEEEDSEPAVEESSETEATVSDGSGVVSETDTISTTTDPSQVTVEESESGTAEADGAVSQVPASSPTTTESLDSGASPSSSLSTSPEVAAQQNVPEDYDVDLPWAVGRENVKSSRSEEKTFFLQEQVAAENGLEVQAKSAVEDILGSSVSRTDLREAAVVLAYSNPEVLAAVLTEWGAEHA